MQVIAIKTHKITTRDRDISEVLKKYITGLEENSVVAVTSKIVAICEGRVLPYSEEVKEELIERESQYFLPRASSKYNLALTVTNNLLVATAGVDESNGDGKLILWPSDPQKSANMIRKFLSEQFGVKNVGVIITDSRTVPLRWGVTGAAIAHSGFKAIKDYVGQKDLFGRDFKFEKLNLADSLAATGVVVMGEGSEQTPLAVITNIPLIEFQQHNPSENDLDILKISLEDDIYAPFLTSAKWEKGGKV